MNFRTLKLRKNPDCPVCGTHPTVTALIDYDQFCGIPKPTETGPLEVAKDAHVTGPIVEVTDTKIVVMKGKDKWELARGADTKVTGELKVGAKVTIEYSMTAKTIEAKDDKAPAKPKAK